MPANSEPLRHNTGLTPPTQWAQPSALTPRHSPLHFSPRRHRRQFEICCDIRSLISGTRMVNISGPPRRVPMVGRGVVDCMWPGTPHVVKQQRQTTRMVNSTCSRYHACMVLFVLVCRSSGPNTVGIGDRGRWLGAATTATRGRTALRCGPKKLEKCAQGMGYRARFW